MTKKAHTEQVSSFFLHQKTQRKSFSNYSQKQQGNHSQRGQRRIRKTKYSSTGHK